MKQASARARRKARHYKRRRNHTTLNLTALMDIFTLLVFFLLFNQNTLQQMPENPDLKLPSSIAQELPDDVLTVQISRHDILVQDRVVMRVSDALAAEARTLPALAEVLDGYAERARRFGSQQEDRELMIIGDRRTDFAVIQRVMFTASQTDYNRVAFAVLRGNGDGGTP